MGFTVQLEAEDGEILDRVVDPNSVLADVWPLEGDARYDYLQVIDWYGDTVFNRLQIAQLLKEWELLYAPALSDEHRKVLDDVRRLALRCQNERQLYLRFVGD